MLQTDEMSAGKGPFPLTRNKALGAFVEGIPHHLREAMKFSVSHHELAKLAVLDRKSLLRCRTEIDHTAHVWRIGLDATREGAKLRMPHRPPLTFLNHAADDISYTAQLNHRSESI